MCDPGPPSFDLNEFIDICSDSTDVEQCRPIKRPKLDPKPKVFVHVSQDVPDWVKAEGMEIIRYKTQRDPALKRKQIGDWRVRKDELKSSYNGRKWTIMCQVPDCPSSAQGDGQGGKAIFCRTHGGGARCQEPDCPSSALGDGQGGKAIYCVKHGGHMSASIVSRFFKKKLAGRLLFTNSAM